MKIGDRVMVTDAKPIRVGVIVDIKSWSEVIGVPGDGTAVKVAVPEWDNGTNGTRWLDIEHISPINNDD